VTDRCVLLLLHEQGVASTFVGGRILRVEPDRLRFVANCRVVLYKTSLRVMQLMGTSANVALSVLNCQIEGQWSIIRALSGDSKAVNESRPKARLAENDETQSGEKPTFE
jgi:hypothetical protein